ncbi:MAG: tRNA (adenosine(37)-N6)-dimethylallyltransferase MiaA [Chthoniobacteraceae bacterium]
MRQDNNYAGRRSRGGRRHRRNTNDGAPRSAAKAPVKLTLWQKIKSWFGGTPAKRSMPKTNTVVVTSSSIGSNGARKTESSRPARKPEVVDVTSPKLYVGNLSFDATESDLFELFKGVGSVQNAEIVSHRHTQKSKGFAFVMMQTVDEARRAVTELPRQGIHGPQARRQRSQDQRRALLLDGHRSRCLSRLKRAQHPSLFPQKAHPAQGCAFFAEIVARALQAGPFMNPAPPMFFLAGPTAVGKSTVAVEVAERLNAEIIGADAFQVYRGLEILTAQPAPELQKRVPHHLIGCLPGSEPFDVNRYLEQAHAAAAAILARGKVPLVVGGAGLYLRALMHGMDELPAPDESLRSRLEALPLETLQQEYARLDPLGAARIDRNNQRRLIRAIEVCQLSGQPYSSFRKDWSGVERAGETTFRAVFLTRDRKLLYERINARVEAMFASGVSDEVGRLGELGPTASQTLGLSEIRQWRGGAITRENALASIQQATRKYAKRQWTWFRRQPEFQWLELASAAEDPAIAEAVCAIFSAQAANPAKRA